jgi:KH domain
MATTTRELPMTRVADRRVSTLRASFTLILRLHSSDSNPPSRYGLGSEERRSQPSHYGSTRGDDLASGEVQDEMNVVDKFVGLIIGRGGENLKRIERDSGAKVQIHQRKSLALGASCLRMVLISMKLITI